MPLARRIGRAPPLTEYGNQENTMATSSTLPPITSLGSGSKLDLQGILDSLAANEKQQLTLIQAQQTNVKTQISAYGTLKSAVDTLQTAAKALADSKTYNVTKATVNGGATEFSVSTQTGATPASYNVKIDALAASQQLKSGMIADRTASMGGGGNITVTLADGTTKTVDVGNDTSLNGIAKAINASDDIGVSASIVNNGSGQSYLILTASDTGTDAAVTKITSSNSAIQGVVGYDSSVPGSPMTQTQAAANAQLKINDVAVTSQSNTVDDIIDNVTITLNQVTTGTQSFTVASDTSGISTAVQTFVGAYNTLQNLVKSLTAYDADAEKGSPLTGDSATRSITSTLSGALRVLSTGASTLKTIQDLGITTDPTDGTLDLNVGTIDSNHLHSLNDSLKTNPQDVENILTALGTNVSNAINGITGSKGLIQTRIDGLNATVDTLQDTYDRTSDRIDADIANIRAQFVQLDAFVAQMNSTSTYLTQQFASLSNSK
jgi:flagellar hook-associated protein 2